MVTEKDKIEDLNYKIEELREYLNVPLESSQDISDLSLRQIIDLEIDHKGYLIDYIEFEKLRAELKGIQSQKQNFIEKIKELKVFVNSRNGENCNGESKTCDCDVCQIARKIGGN